MRALYIFLDMSASSLKLNSSTARKKVIDNRTTGRNQQRHNHNNNHNNHPHIHTRTQTHTHIQTQPTEPSRHLLFLESSGCVQYCGQETTLSFHFRWDDGGSMDDDDDEKFHFKDTEQIHIVAVVVIIISDMRTVLDVVGGCHKRCSRSQLQQQHNKQQHKQQSWHSQAENE